METENRWIPSRRWRMQGQARNTRHSKSDMKLLRYIVGISLKHRIDPDKLFSRIVRAWKNGESRCGQLVIECRQKMGAYAIFLITANQEAISQFSVSEHLLEQNAPLKRFAYAIESKKKLALQKRKDAKIVMYHKIRDLKAGMKRINLKARVLSISKPQQALTKYCDYVPFVIAALVDGTGIIKLTLWSSRINSLSTNDTIEIKNARVIAYQGETQLRIRKQGVLRVIGNAYT